MAVDGQNARSVIAVRASASVENNHLVLAVTDAILAEGASIVGLDFRLIGGHGFMTAVVFDSPGRAVDVDLLKQGVVESMAKHDLDDPACHVIELAESALLSMAPVDAHRAHVKRVAAAHYPDPGVINSIASWVRLLGSGFFLVDFCASVQIAGDVREGYIDFIVQVPLLGSSAALAHQEFETALGEFMQSHDGLNWSGLVEWVRQ